jgi:hypothetical protein
MNHRPSIAAIGVVLAAAGALSAFAINYNSSKSNSGNIVVHSPTVTETQAAAILASLDKSRQAPTEAAIQGFIKAAGVKQGAIKAIIIEPNQGKTNVLLLDDPADEKTARAAMINAASSHSNTQHN